MCDLTPGLSAPDNASQDAGKPRKMTREELEAHITIRFNALKKGDFSYLEKEMGTIGWLPAQPSGWRWR